MYGQRIEGLKGDLVSADRKIADYKEKLEGKSPDEAQAQIAKLQDDIAALASYGLYREAKDRLRLSLSSLRGAYVKVTRTVDAMDADRLFREVFKEFTEAGWIVEGGIIMGPSNQPPSGVTLLHWSETDGQTLATVRLALQAAGLDAAERKDMPATTSTAFPQIVFSSRDPDWKPAARWS